MKRYVLVAAVFAFLLCPAMVWAQLATINGTVTDPSGAVVPSAVIKVTNQNTAALVRTVTTNAEGLYVVPLLPPSEYSLDVTRSGFKTFTRSGITLRADQHVTVNFTLQVGTRVQTVTVHAAPPLVNVTTGTLSEVVQRTRIVNLPLNGRNAADLTLLVTGAESSSSQSSDQGNSKTFPVAVTASINGSRPNDTSFNLDGAPNTDNYTDVNQPFPFPDALEEFSVLTSNYSAKYGNDAGGVVNIVTKSGTNQYHGDAFEFVRNAVFNARNYFATNRDQLKRNQFGGTIGGPVHLGPSWLKNKSWFFGGLQITTIRNVSGGHHATIPTPADLNGDFSALLNPNSPENPTGKAVTIIDPVTGQPFPGNIIDPATRYDPAALAFAKYLPIGSASPDGSLFYSVPGIHQNYWDWVGRFDYQLNNNNTFEARATWDRFTNPGQFSNTSNILSETSGSKILSENYLLSWTHIVRSNIVNRARIGFSRIASKRGPPPGVPDYSTLGVVGPYPNIVPAVPDIGVSGFFSVGDTPPALFARNNEDYGDDANWVHGRHNIAFGASFSQHEVNIDNNFLAPGDFQFTSDTTNYSPASFFLGFMRTYRQANGDYENKRETNMGFYVQDDYRMTRRLTLNMGLRYEPFFPIGFPRGDFGVFLPQNYYAGVHTAQFVNAPVGILFRGDKGVPYNGMKGDYNNWMPRFGFAYNVFGNGKTVLRGGGGVFYESAINLIEINRAEDITPFDSSVFFTNPAGPFSNPYLNSGTTSVILVPLTPTKNSPFPLPYYNAGFQGLPFIVPVTYDFNLTVEQQLGHNWMLRLAYVGSHMTHYLETIMENPSAYIPGSTLSLQQRRLYPDYANLDEQGYDINSNYNSAQVTLQKRFDAALPLTLLASYTYSKSLDTQPIGAAADQLGAESYSPIPYYMPGRHQFDYGPSVFNQGQNFVASYVWQLPALAKMNPAVQGVFGHWALTGIFTAHSGLPVTAMASSDTSQTGLGRERAVYIGGPSKVSNPLTACANSAPCVTYLNPSSFADPAVGGFGNVGKGFINAPGYLDWDMGFFKNIPLKSERYRLQFRGEFFNTFNTVNFGGPSTTVLSPSFGEITSANDPRIIQLAIKLFF